MGHTATLFRSMWLLCDETKLNVNPSILALIPTTPLSETLIVILELKVQCEARTRSRRTKIGKETLEILEMAEISEMSAD